MSAKQVDQAVESICDRGCRYVNTILNDDAARTDCEALSGLGEDEMFAVLKELKTVMSVYDQTGSCEI